MIHGTNGKVKTQSIYLVFENERFGVKREAGTSC